jgi:small subunit ribosomal protein S9
LVKTATKKTTKVKKEITYYYGTGRRKTSIARVRLLPGTGRFILNGGRSLEEYFPRKTAQMSIVKPLLAVAMHDTFDVVALLEGGGSTGQAGALRLGIARALVESNPDFRLELKRQGFLTRDPRMIERKKYGLKKARKKPQFSKR